MYLLLKELRCATALEVATRLGVPRKTAQMCLNHLAARGVVEKRVLGRRAVMYCFVEDAAVSSHEKRNSERKRRGVQGNYKSYTATRERLTQALEMLRRSGCASVGALMRELQISHTKAYHMLHVALFLRVGVKVRIGRTAMLCRDRETAEDVILRIRDAVHRLAVENGMRHVTASKILRAALRNRDVYELLSRFVPLRRDVARFPPVVLAFVSGILKSLYGKPLRRGSKLIYIALKPRSEHGIEIIDSYAVNPPAAVQAADQTAPQAAEQPPTLCRT